MPTRSAENRVMPQFTLRTTVNDREESISEYICDWPDCPNVATHVVGVVRELRLRSAMCDDHAAELRRRHLTPGRLAR